MDHQAGTLLFAQEGNDPTGFQIRTFAIVGATIIPRPGEIIEDGVIVVDRGIIVDVGPRGTVNIPPDAQQRHLKGYYIYPGFLDAGSSRFLNPEKKPKSKSGRKIDFRKYVLAATRTDNRNHLTPLFQAASALKWEEKQLEEWRKLGITAVHVVPTGRLASGQGSLVSLGRGTLQENLLQKGTLAHFRIFAPGGSAYPHTLMGATAHLRQFFLDAQHHQQHRELYQSGVAGISRPPLDAELEYLTTFLSHEKPQTALFEIHTRDDLERSSRFANEFGLNAMYWIEQNLSESLTDLKAISSPFLLKLKPKSEVKIQQDTNSKRLNPKVKEPLRVQADKQRKWKAELQFPGELARQEIPFAISLSQFEKPVQFYPALRQLREWGLTSEAALAALTTEPAKLLGMKDRLGEIKPGALAHFSVMTAPFDHPEMKVRMVYVENDRFFVDMQAKPIEKDKRKPAPLFAFRPGSHTDHVSNSSQMTKGQQPVELERDRISHRPATKGNLLITNATILTGTGKTLKNSSILIRNGKIEAIGKQLDQQRSSQEKMTVIDATNRTVIPGIIDTHSHIKFTGGINETSQSIVGEVRVKDTINTEDVAEFRALAGGVTTIRMLHGSANVIGGQDTVVKLKYGAKANDQILHDAPQGIKFALGENVKYRTTRFPNTRLGVEATLNRAFVEAVDYRNRWRDFQKNQKSASSSVLAPRRDLRLETLANIVNHETFIHSHCYRADEILMLLRIADNLGFRIWSLQHVLEGYKIAPEIVKHGASCSTFADWWAYKIEAYDATPFNAALLLEAGANIVIKSDNNELLRHMYYEGAKPIKYGNVAAEDALKMITLNAAKELGLSQKIGSIELGKDADLAIFNGHPFNSFSRCEMTIIDGEIFYQRDRLPTVMSSKAQQQTKHPDEWKLGSPEIRAKQLHLEKHPHNRYAILNATLHPVESPVIPNGTILIENDTIVAMGKEIDLPERLHQIDASGLHVYPGLIDSGTTLGLVEIGKVRETHDYNESGDYQPDLRAAVAVNPDSELIPVARAGGITTIHLHPTGGILSGQTSLMKLAGWTAPEMTLNLEHGLQVNWPNGDSTKAKEKLKSLFQEAKSYQKLKEKAKKRMISPPIADPRFEAILPYVSGKKPVYIEADSRKQIAEVLLFAEQEKLKVVITGGTDAWKLATELKERNVPVIVGPVMRAPTESYDPQDAPYANPGRLHEAGVKFCIRSDNASNSRNAPFEAAMAVAHGLPEEIGLRAVTLSAAEILGLEKQYGSLAVGKKASLIITDGSPLQITSQIKGVFIDGVPFPPESRQTRFYKRYRQRLHEYQKQQQ